MRTLKRRPTILTLSFLAALLLVPVSANAATNFGSRLNHDPANSGECEPLGTCTLVSFIHPSDPEGDPYAGGAPVDGVITKFRIRAYVLNEPTQVTFRLADINRPDPNDESTALATAAGTGPTVTLQVNEDLIEAPIQEFPGRLPVKKGQHLAIDGGKYLLATINDSGQEFSYVFSPPLVDGSGARGSLESTGELLVAATIEPDADGDGFGDETQDACPTQGTTQGACDLTKPAVSGLKVKDGKVAYKLSEAATVTLKLEKKAPGRKVGKKCVKPTAKNKAKKACNRWRPVGKAFGGTGKAGANSVTLPKGKNLAPGTYKLTLTAVDAAGNKTVQATKFTVAPKLKKGK
ncbi:MAG TPA: hypothetical protein VFB52_08885 [Solirubrobacterales bacterium]|nr:hypothetical protein [Solirubrobacterales bacterium]